VVLKIALLYSSAEVDMAHCHPGKTYYTTLGAVIISGRAGTRGTHSPVKPAQLQASDKKKHSVKAREYSSAKRVVWLYLTATERERQLRLSDIFPGVLF